MIFPLTVPVKQLNSYHCDYAANSKSYENFTLLYDGGVRFREEIGRFLRTKPKEMPDVYVKRQELASYTNLLSNIIGWYSSALLETAPQIITVPAGAEWPAPIPGKPAPPPPELRGQEKQFCEAFEEDCDRGGTAFVDFWGQALESLLLYRSGYVLVDLPGGALSDDEPLSLAQQTDSGMLDPYLVFYDPTQVINWAEDSHGNLDWVAIYIRCEEQEFLQDAKKVDYWYYFDRKECVLYQREVPEKERSVPGDAIATLAKGYPRPHAMADQNRVPIRKVSVNKGLWLANRVYLPLLNHFNLDNSLDFGLFQSNLAQLVIEDGVNGRYEETGIPSGGPPTSSAVGYHALPNGGKMYYLEPAGKSFATSQERVASLEERIYKACYLQDQARTNKSTPTAQSGISKEHDKTPSRNVLSKFGDIIRAWMQAVYKDVLTIRGLAVEVDIRGLDFSDKSTAEDMDLLEKSQIVPVNSPTFEREVGKKLVRLSLNDMNPAVLKTIDDEIDTNPTPNQQEAQQQEQQRADMLTKFTSTFKGAEAIQ